MSSREDTALWRGSLFCIFFHNASVLNIQVLMERKLPSFIASCLPSKPLILCCVSLILPRIYRCRAWGSSRLVTGPLSQEKRKNFHLWDYRPSRIERISHEKSRAPWHAMVGWKHPLQLRILTWKSSSEHKVLFLYHSIFICSIYQNFWFSWCLEKWNGLVK